jgi:hypothetical protein
MRPLSSQGSPELPTFFRACILAAACGGSYADAGYHLAIRARSLVHGHVEAREQRRLDRLVTGADSAPIWEWFARNLPRCVGLVPPNKKRSFMRGILRAIDEGRL